MNIIAVKWRHFCARVGATSTWALLANSLNVASRLYQAFFAFYYGASKLTGWNVGPYKFWIFVCSLAYSSLHSLLPTGSAIAKHWAQKESKRTNMLTVAIGCIAAALDLRRMTEVSKSEYLSAVLAAAKCEVEKMVLDSSGMYLNVTLMVQQPADWDKLTVIARAEHVRPTGVEYRRSQTVIGRAMMQKSLAYDPETNVPGRPYRSILAYPLLRKKGNTVEVVGGISIDSSRPHHFDGWEEEIQAKLLLYFELVKLVLK